MKKHISLYFCGLLLVLALPVTAQKQYTANEAADSAQSWRGNARALWAKKNASKQEMDQGIKMMQHVISFVDSTPIKTLSQWSLYLQFRKSDLTRDLVYAYVMNHQYEEALAELEATYQAGSSAFILQMEKEPEFAEIKSDARFIAAMNKFRARIALNSNAAFKTAFQPDLPPAEKLAGLSLLWMHARNNFVYFDRLSADWNQTYLDFIPQVTATKSTLEYYNVLRKFYAQLRDGHSNVYAPNELSKYVYTKPPVTTGLIEGRVFITAVGNDSLQKAGILPGLEILKIDGIPVKEYANTYVKPYQSSSTQQDLELREYTYSLLRGDASKPLALELRDKKGKVFTQVVVRSGYPNSKAKPAMEYREIGQVGYLTINNFEDEKIVKQFDSLFTQINKTKGLIIDIRDNGGGDSGIGNQILASLTDKTFDLFAYKHIRLDAMHSEPIWADNGIAKQPNNKKQFYNKPIVLLVNAATFSAAEDFTVAFDYMKRGKILGQPTGGSTGQPIFLNLPGGGTARVCGRRETYPDGKEFVGVGIKPDIVIDKSISDLYNGTDSVLKKALELLK